MRVIDCFMPLIARIVDFRDALPACPPYEQVKGEIRQLLAQSETMSRGGALDPEQYDAARFIVCAWVDETLLGSQWCDTHRWQHEQLQRHFYQTTDAGVEAFERLQALGQKQQAREVFCLCLALGFRGRYLGPEGELQLEQVRSAQRKLLFDAPQGVPDIDGMELFPGALVPDCQPRAAEKVTWFPLRPLPAMLITSPFILFVVLYLVYRYVLSGLVLPDP